MLIIGIGLLIMGLISGFSAWRVQIHLESGDKEGRIETAEKEMAEELMYLGLT